MSHKAKMGNGMKATELSFDEHSADNADSIAEMTSSEYEDQSELEPETEVPTKKIQARKQSKGYGAPPTYSEHDSPKTAKLRDFLLAQYQKLDERLRKYATTENKQRKELKSKVAFLEKSKRELENDNKVMRQDAFLRMQENAFHGEYDEGIQEFFRQSAQEMKNWAKQWSVEKPATNIDGAHWSTVISDLTSGPNPYTSEQNFNIALKQGIHASAVLNSILSKYVFDNLLDQKFFFLEYTEGLHGSADLSNAIMDLFKVGSRGNLQQASIWLSQTMKMLHPRDLKNTSIDYAGDITRSKVTYYWNRTSEFMDRRSVKHLLRVTDDDELKKAMRQLVDILKSVGDFLLKLGTQKVRVEVLTSCYLKRPLSKGLTRDCIPHPCMKMDEDNGISRTHHVLLLVEPAIVGYGNEDGERYNHYKVWRKAMVILSYRPVRTRSAAARERHKKIHGGQSEAPLSMGSGQASADDETEQDQCPKRKRELDLNQQSPIPKKSKGENVFTEGVNEAANEDNTEAPGSVETVIVNQQSSITPPMSNKSHRTKRDKQKQLMKTRPESRKDSLGKVKKGSSMTVDLTRDDMCDSKEEQIDGSETAQE